MHCDMNVIITKNNYIIDYTCSKSHLVLMMENDLPNDKNESVKITLTTKDNKWWSGADTWDFNIDQDIIPAWYTDKADEYKTNLIAKIKHWQKQHVRIGKNIDEISDGYCILENCHVHKITKKAKVELHGNTHVDEICDHVYITVMCDESTIDIASGQSYIKDMYDMSKILLAKDHVVISKMYNFSIIEKTEIQIIIGTMYDSSKVICASGETNIVDMQDNSVTEQLIDKSCIHQMKGHSCTKLLQGTANILIMRDESFAEKISEKSFVKIMYDMSFLECVCDHAIVKNMCDLATAFEVMDYAIIELIDGNNTIKTIRDMAKIKIARGNCVIDLVYSEETRIMLLTDNAIAANILCQKNIRKIGSHAIAIDKYRRKIYTNEENGYELCQKRINTGRQMHR